MPYPNEHACRLRDPKGLDILGSGSRKHNGKTFRIIFGRPKGAKSGSMEQAYRYPKASWSADEARRHCQAHDGRFEAAGKSVQQFVPFNPLKLAPQILNYFKRGAKK